VRITSPNRCSVPCVHACELEGRAVGLWGAGREAASAYRALSSAYPPNGFLVFSDSPVAESERAQFTGGAPVRFADGPGGIPELAACEVVIRSPGISRYRPELERLREAGVRLSTATNLWMAEHSDERVLAVTGTKGKSTTASLLTHLARSQGTKTVLAGNIGEPLLDHLSPAEPVDLWVLELSSYQAADLECSPMAAVVLNLYPEHIDWHGSHERYYADKLNVLRDSERVLAVLNARDPRLRALRAPAKTVWFGGEGSYDTQEGAIVLDGETVLSADENPLRGEHNALNICAALSALAALGMPLSDPARAIKGFSSLPHRLQQIAVCDGLRYVDDGISTTPQSTIAALRALSGSPVALIAGGYDRVQDYTELAQRILEEDVVAVVGLPDTGERLLGEIKASAGASGARPPRLELAENIEQAVQIASGSLTGGGVVLLSPAAPSYGAFRNFEERSEHFVAAVDRQTSSSVRR
jgi:UDP-N-acetylmuramoyl-L-alanine---L-glutamate ligase